MNVTLLPAVVIGAWSFVGAGSVVTTDVAPAVVVVGNPARPLKTVEQVVCPLDLQPGLYLREAVGRKSAR
jgi:acetyltransferase-like isoleucine patch superfamily enzyme